MHYAVSSYSFSRLVKSGEMSYKDILSKAKEMGFEAVELVEIEQHADGDVIAFAKELRDEAERLGIILSNFAFRADFISAEHGTEQEIVRVKKMIDVAQVLGVPSVRHDVLWKLGVFDSFEAALPSLAAAAREIAAYGAEKGIRTTVENHGYICQGSERMQALYKAVAHENFSLLCDVGNFLCADEEPVSAVESIAPYTGYVHVKDFLRIPANQPNPGDGYFKSSGGNYLLGTVVGNGVVDVKQCLAILQKAGYDSYVTIEFEGKEPVLQAIADDLEIVKSYIEKNA